MKTNTNKRRRKYALAAILAGLLNGLLGTGGGVPLYFALSRDGAEKSAYATASVGVFLLSLQTLFLYQNSATLPQHFSPFFVFLAVAGGALGAYLLGRIPQKTLRFIFSGLLILSGGYLLVKELCFGTH